MDAKGQSILEVIFMLPFLFIFVGLLFKLNMGIQMAINNAQYARAQVFMLTNNSSEYPRLAFRSSGALTKNEDDLLLLGVSDPSALSEAADGGDMPAIPQTQKIGGSPNSKGSSESGEVSSRTNIRVRDTAAICTQMNSVSKGKAMDSYQITGLKNQRWPFRKTVCQYNGKWIGD
jgi:hypothetical protein